jgi:acyl dehydratase
LTARSTVVDKRESQSRPGSGILTWHTEGFLLEPARGSSNDGERVIDFRRSNLVPKRGPSPS